MSLHSIDAGICWVARTLRCAARASHTIKMNINKAVNEIMAPSDDRTFHCVKASG